MAAKTQIRPAFAALCLLALLPAAPVHAASGAPAAIPPLDHIFLIVMENTSYGQVINNAHAPFINRLAREANRADNYYAVGHPSLTNYLEIVGGSNFGIQNDNAPNWHGASTDKTLNGPLKGAGTDAPTPSGIAPFNRAIPAAPYVAKTIADQLAAAGRRWKTYQEDLPGRVDGVNFSDGVNSNLNHPPQKVAPRYAVKHNPFVYFSDIQEGKDSSNSLRNVAGFGGGNGLYADLRSGQVPDFSFIVPNQCHDMHGIPGVCGDESALIEAGDHAVQELVEAIETSRVWKTGRNAIIVTWDENDFSNSPNRVATLVVTSYGVQGIASRAPYSHFSLLKTLEAGFGVSCLNHACDGNVEPMSDLFNLK